MKLPLFNDPQEKHPPLVRQAPGQPPAPRSTSASIYNSGVLRSGVNRRQGAFTFLHEAATSAGYRHLMTASDTQGRAWRRLWAAVRGGLSLRAVILACLTCGLAAESVKLFDVIRMTLSPRLEQSHVAQTAHAARHTGGIDVGAIAAAHLFGRHDPATQRESAANGREELSLSGILFFSGNNSLSRIMLMEYPKTSFAVGDRVTEGVVVGAISPRYAILSDGGRQRVLRLSWKKRNPGGGGTANGNFNDDLDASNDDSSKPPPVLEPYEDPVGDG